MTLFEGGITSGFGGVPLPGLVNVEIDIYVSVLFRNTQKDPSAGAVPGRTRVFTLEFVIS
jgi:hypothetical protein